MLSVYELIGQRQQGLISGQELVGILFQKVTETPGIRDEVLGLLRHSSDAEIVRLADDLEQLSSGLKTTDSDKLS